MEIFFQKKNNKTGLKIDEPENKKNNRRQGEENPKAILEKPLYLL